MAETEQHQDGAVSQDRQDPRHPGGRIRAERRRHKLSVRELARRSGLTPSHVSKIERGVTNPSVGALYKLSDVLGLTVAQLFPDSPGPDSTELSVSVEELRALAEDVVMSPLGATPVVAPGRREVIKMTGVEFQRLTPADDEIVEFIEVRHEVGAGDEEAYHHRGREYGIVLDGRLQVEVGFDKYVLEPGYSIAFDSSVPHRVLNIGEVPATAIWLTIGRGHPR